MYLGTFSYLWLNLLMVPKRLYIQSYGVTDRNTFQLPFICNKKYREFFLINMVEYFFFMLEVHLITYNHIKVFHGNKEASFSVVPLRTSK